MSRSAREGADVTSKPFPYGKALQIGLAMVGGLVVAVATRSLIMGVLFQFVFLAGATASEQIS
jgi:hypothetical protein